MSLYGKMAKGAAWMVLFKLTERGIGLVSTVILARVLVPEDFGLIAMAMAILAVLELLSTFSFDLALIQHASAERRHYDTAWTFNVIFGCANALGLIALALPVSWFYAEPRVAGVMCAVALSVFVSRFANIGVVAFQKELQFHKEFYLGVAKKLIAFSVTVILAITLRNYWALLAGQITSSVAGTLLSYVMHPYRPRLCLQGRKELFHFSKWLLLNNMLIAISHRAADFVLGKFSGPGSLGTYSIAYEISNLPTTELVAPIGRAVFPGYTIMAKQDDELRRGFVDVLSVIIIVALPLGVGIIVLAEPLVQVLLGQKWAASVPLIQVLGVFGILRASASNMGSIYMAVGRPRLLTNLTILQLVILLPSLIFLVPEHGALGAAIAVTLAVTIQVPVGFSVVMRTIGLGFRGLIAVIWRPLAAVLTMGAAIQVARVVWFSQAEIQQPKFMLQLITLVPFGAGIYVITLLVLWAINSKPRGAESILLLILKNVMNRILPENIRVR